MADPFVAEIRIFPFNFAPTSWAFCSGQLMPIAQNTALFSLLGTTYGGDGKVTFALPDLQGRTPLQQGQGPGLTDRVLGESGGSTDVSLIMGELSAHSHGLTPFSQSEGTELSPQGQCLAGSPGGYALYLPEGSPPNYVAMNPAMIEPAGGSNPHNNMMPYLALNFCIALQGVFPSRP